MALTETTALSEVFQKIGANGNSDYNKRPKSCSGLTNDSTSIKSCHKSVVCGVSTVERAVIDERTS
jgi:hypothetical protein